MTAGSFTANPIHCVSVLHDTVRSNRACWWAFLWFLALSIMLWENVGFHIKAVLHLQFFIPLQVRWMTSITCHTIPWQKLSQIIITLSLSACKTLSELTCQASCPSSLTRTFPNRLEGKARIHHIPVNDGREKRKIQINRPERSDAESEQSVSCTNQKYLPCGIPD